MEINLPTHLPYLLKRSSICIMVLALTLFFPAASFAETAAPAEPCTPPPATQNGVNVPTGSDARMFHYDCDVDLWVSSHYTYNPVTHVTLPRDPIVYTYNDSTGLWDAPIWTYVTSDGVYTLRTHSVVTPPAGANTVGGPKPAAPVAISSSPPSSNEAAAAATTSAGTTAAIASATAGSTTSTSMAMNNTIGAIAASGGATVFANTLGGNATTGNAQSLATVMNMLQSSASGFMPGDNAVTFVSNINGDVNGDLLLDPALIGTIQPTSGPSDGTLSINALNDTSQSIANDINLDATTGNARVDANTRAGNATSGNATAIANVVNMLNSAITSGKSFLGVVNINGNLNGDILLPPHFIDQLIASNVPTVTINTSLDLNNNVSQSIANHVNADATSGNATVGMNTTAGSATTGTAKTNITAFNLTHSGVVGTNSLLVFVNVLGTWYGMIFDAPPGTTTAQLGSGITSYDSNTDVAAQNNVNQSILNNINVNAHSGDADVARNTTAGNATSGNAYAAVNVLNVADSNMSLANWFGILFINVFGSWNGSFGIDTAAGDPPVTAPAATDDPVTAVSQIPKTFATFHYTPTSANHNTSSSAGSSSTSNNASASLSQGGAVLAASHTQSGSNLTTPSASTNVKSANFLLPALGISLGVLMLLAERFRSLRRANT